MSLVRPEYHIPTYDEIRDLGAKEVEPVIAKDLADLIDDPNIVLPFGALMEIAKLIQFNFSGENQKIIYEAFSRASNREEYRETMFTQPLFGIMESLKNNFEW